MGEEKEGHRGELGAFLWLLGFVVLLAAAVLASHPASAEQKEIHDAWHKFDDTFTLEKRVFSLMLGSDETLLRVRIDNDTMFVSLHKCVDYDVYEVCFDNESIEVTAATFIGANAIPGIRVRVMKETGPNLAVTFQVPKMNPAETKRVNLTLANNDNISVDSFTCELLVPQGLTVSNPGEFVKSGNKLTLTGSVRSGDVKKYSFQVTSGADSGGAKKANYTVWMTGEGVTRNKTGSISMDVSLPYQVTVYLTPANPNIMEEAKLLVSVKDTGVDDLVITDAQVRGPVFVYYTPGKELSWEGIGRYSSYDQVTIKAGESRNYSLDITSPETGKYNFTGSISMRYRGAPLVSYFNKSTTFSAKGMAPSLLTNKEAVLSGDTVEVVYYLSDTSDDLYFSNMSAAVKGWSFTENLSLGMLLPGDEKQLMRRTYNVPLVEKDTNFPINVTLNYLTASNQAKQLNTSKNIRVTSNGTIISIDQRLSSSTAYTGQEVIVEVSLKNMKEEPFDLEVADVPPAGVDFVGGVLRRNLSLLGKESQLAYSYKVRVPLNFTGKGVNFSSTVKISALGYEKTDGSYLTVRVNLTNATNAANASKAGASGALNASKGSSGRAGASSGGTLGNENLIKRIFRGIENFFTGLFSKK